MPGVGGSPLSSATELAGDTREVSVLDRSVTGLMVEPFVNGEAGEDLGDRGVSGLNDSGFKPSALLGKDGNIDLSLKFDVVRSKLGTLIDLEGIFERTALSTFAGVDGTQWEAVQQAGPLPHAG